MSYCICKSDFEMQQHIIMTKPHYACLFVHEYFFVDLFRVFILDAIAPALKADTPRYSNAMNDKQKVPLF